MSSTASPTAVLQRLEALGVQLLLDDFGTGYSSLNHLKRFPITGMKVDRSFIAGITEGEEDRHILEAILRMADALGLSVVAEGVETVEQARLLSRARLPRAAGLPVLRAGAGRRDRDAAALGAAARPARRGVRHGRAGAAAAARPSRPRPAEGPTVALGEAAQALSISHLHAAALGRLRADRLRADRRRAPPLPGRRAAPAQPRGTARRRAGRAHRRRPGRPAARRSAALLAEAPRDLAPTRPSARSTTGSAGLVRRRRRRARARPLPRRAPPAPRARGRLARGPGRHASDLLLPAHYAGASLLERHTFVERLGDVAVRGLAQRDAPRSEIVGVRRLFARLAQALLDEPYAA